MIDNGLGIDISGIPMELDFVGPKHAELFRNWLLENQPFILVTGVRFVNSNSGELVLRITYVVQPNKSIDFISKRAQM